MNIIDNRIAKIKDELDKRRHSWLMQPCLSEEEISNFEQSYDITIPDEYRRFLLIVGNGGPGPFYGVYPLDVAISSDPTPYKRYSDNIIGESVSPTLLRTAFPSRPESESSRKKIAYGAAPGTLALAHYGCGTIEDTVFMIVAKHFLIGMKIGWLGNTPLCGT
jgi:SMI1 / KNR4 family (SUKH-1)